MRKLIDYLPISNDDQTSLLSMCLPQGQVWDSKGNKDSTFYALLKSLATEINALEEKVYRLVTQWDIRVTVDLITEWEQTVGIPDECRDIAEDIATRRSDVLDKLRKIPIITIDDYKALAESVTGEPAADWNIRPGIDDFPSNRIYQFVLLVTSPSVTEGAFNYPWGSGTLAVSGITRSGSIATATVSDTSTMVDSSTVTIAGAGQTEYNGDFEITITSGTTFDYTVTGTPVTPATGTITVNFGIDQTQLDSLASSSQFLFKPGTAFAGYPFAGSFRTDVLKCVFRKITPANVVVVFD